MQKSIELKSPTQQLRDREAALAMLDGRLKMLMQVAVDGSENSFRMLCTRLESVNPLAVLSHGYSMVEDSDGRIVSSVTDISVGDAIRIKLADGAIDATVNGTSLNEK